MCSDSRVSLAVSGPVNIRTTLGCARSQGVLHLSLPSPFLLLPYLGSWHHAHPWLQLDATTLGHPRALFPLATSRACPGLPSTTLRPTLSPPPLLSRTSPQPGNCNSLLRRGQEDLPEIEFNHFMLY